jgi:hypothetical protein
MLAAARAQPHLNRVGSYQGPSGEVTIFVLVDPRPDDGR